MSHASTDDPMIGRYLEVEFHDNDFGFPLVAALKRLWEYVVENNEHLIGVANRSVADMFHELHDAGALESMIQRLFVLETLCLNVEYKTRGLYWETVNWSRSKITEPPAFTQYDDYLSCSVSFHDDLSFTKPDQNGENAWLDLVTGKSESF